MFDVYRPSSLKAETRSNRRVKASHSVADKGKMSPNWRNFLRDNNSKTVWFNFLADKIIQMRTPNAVIVTKEEDDINNKTISLDGDSL